MMKGIGRMQAGMLAYDVVSPPAEPLPGLLMSAQAFCLQLHYVAVLAS